MVMQGKSRESSVASVVFSFTKNGNAEFTHLLTTAFGIYYLIHVQYTVGTLSVYACPLTKFRTLFSACDSSSISQPAACGVLQCKETEVNDHQALGFAVLRTNLPTAESVLYCYVEYAQWRTERGGLGCSNPPRNSEDIGGVLDRMSKKNRRLDFHL